MMRKAKVFVSGNLAGILYEIQPRVAYRFEYLPEYSGQSVSITMPATQKVYEYTEFPPFFDGLLPEGYQLDGLLKVGKIDRNDLFSQLLSVGDDMVGNITVKEELP
jgi:serine/threonine-protein kinase HipA